MEIKEEPCGIKDEETEELIGPVEVDELKQPHHFKNEDANAAEQDFTQKQVQTAEAKELFACSECGRLINSVNLFGAVSEFHSEVHPALRISPLDTNNRCHIIITSHTRASF
ncbi:C2H2-type zinc finger protein isoform X1 [Danio rerio]|uniref:C2H2-type zinc finger protein isoform X1 n=1 Tax=Danio rerio TaxID=7955 RepID=A0AC58I7V9_DANRE